jgi:hypothetical protein
MVLAVPLAPDELPWVAAPVPGVAWSVGFPSAPPVSVLALPEPDDEAPDDGEVDCWACPRTGAIPRVNIVAAIAMLLRAFIPTSAADVNIGILLNGNFRACVALFQYDHRLAIKFGRRRRNAGCDCSKAEDQCKLAM